MANDLDGRTLGTVKLRPSAPKAFPETVRRQFSGQAGFIALHTAHGSDNLTSSAFRRLPTGRTRRFSPERMGVNLGFHVQTIKKCISVWLYCI